MTAKVHKDDLFQKPNLPIIVGLIASVLALSVFVVPLVGVFFLLLAFGAWFTWAWLEIFQGTNLYRRVLGGVTMMLLFLAAFTVILL